MTMAESEQVIELSGRETLQAVRRVVGSAKFERLVLVVPPGHPAFANAVRLKVIGRQATAGKGLALVTEDPALHERAGALGLSSFRTVEEARRAAQWRPGVAPFELPAPLEGGPRGREPLRARRRAARGGPSWGETVMLISLIFGVMVLLSALLLLVGPSARVTLIPQQVNSEIAFPLTIDPNAQEVDLANGILPGELRVEFVQGTESIAVSGRRDVPSAPATGRVTFVNVTGEAVTIPAETIVSTSSGTAVRFRTLEAVGLPGELNAQATAPIEAVAPGPVGNVGPLQINLIEGSAATTVRAFNETPTEGGAVEQRPVVTAEDKAQLFEQLRQRLLQEGQAAVERAIAAEGSDGFLVPGTVGVEITAESYNGAVDDPVEMLSLDLRARFSAIVISREVVERLALRALDQQIPEAFMLLDSGQRVTASEATVGEQGLPVITVTASGVAAAQLSESEIRSMVRGQSLDEARALLAQGLPLADDPAIELSPDGWGRMPFLPIRIFVRFAQLDSDVPGGEPAGGGEWR